MPKSTWMEFAARAGLAALCLTAGLQQASASATADLIPAAALPCKPGASATEPDHHVFFPDDNLEQLALRMSPGLYADPTIYARLVRDIATIRALNPTLKAVGYRPHQEIRVLRVTFESTTFWRARTSIQIGIVSIASWAPRSTCTRNSTTPS